MEREDGLRGERAACAARRRPMLIIHVFNATLQTEENGKLEIVNPVVSMSICLPGTNQSAKARIYQVNAVYRKQLELFDEELDDDEAIIDRENDAL